METDKIYLRILKGLSKEELKKTIQHFNESLPFSSKRKEIKEQTQQNKDTNTWKSSTRMSASDFTKSKREQYIIHFQNGDSLAVNAKQIKKLPEEERSDYLQKKIKEYVLKNENIKPEDANNILEYCQKNAKEIYSSFQNRKSIETPDMELIKNFETYYTITLADDKVLKMRTENLLSAMEKQEQQGQPRDVWKLIEPKIEEHMQQLEHLGIELTEVDPWEKPWTEPIPSPEEPKVSDNIVIYLPEYQQSEAGFSEICGLEKHFGTVQQIDKYYIFLQEEDGTTTRFERSEIYSERQVDMMNKAIEKGFDPTKLNLLGKPQLSIPQMEQISLGLQHRLSVYQVAYYSSSAIEAWQMDIYRHGMENGLSFYDMQDTIQHFTSKFSSFRPRMKACSRAWEESRHEINKMIKTRQSAIIKDLKDNNCPPHPRIVKKIGQLHSLTSKEYKIKDILSMVEMGKENKETLEETGKLMREIRNEVKYQTEQMIEMMCR